MYFSKAANNYCLEYNLDLQTFLLVLRNQVSYLFKISSVTFIAQPSLPAFFILTPAEKGIRTIMDTGVRRGVEGCW